MQNVNIFLDKTRKEKQYIKKIRFCSSRTVCFTFSNYSIFGAPPLGLYKCQQFSEPEQRTTFH